MSALDFETMVAKIMDATKCDRARAEDVARANGAEPPAPDPAAAEQAARDAAVLEKEEQREVVKRFRVCGFEVWSYSQPRATKQSPGVPDLLFTHRERPLATFFEVKRQRGGRVSEHQVRFAVSCARTGLSYAIGDRYDAERWLVEHDVATVVAGVLEPLH